MMPTPRMLGTDQSRPARSSLRLGGVPGWKAVATVPLEECRTRVCIDGQILGVDEDLPAIVSYFRNRSPHAYTSRWMEKSVFTKPNEEAARFWMEEGKIQYGRYPAVWLPLEKLTWAENPFQNLNWPWYHHQALAAHYLLAAARSDGARLEEVARLVRSWAAANYVPCFPSALSWNDHATAYRLRTFLCVFEVCRCAVEVDAEFIGCLLRLIDTHCRVLADESFFTRHTNHGFDQSVILFWATRALPELADAGLWCDLSVNRVREEIAQMFTAEGVHVENSPSYHIWMLGAIEEYQILAGKENDAELESLMDKGWEFAAYLLLPNGRLPMIGDTEARDFSRARSSSLSAGFQHFLYSATLGRSGSCPERVDRVFPASGYAVLRDQWHRPESFAMTVHLFFKCSFLSDYHRHDDDLSLVLFGLGEEWLIDSGLFGYEEDHVLRQYMRSVEAHNTVLVDGAEVIRRRSDLPVTRTGMVGFHSRRKTSVVKARSVMQRGYVVERQIAFCKPRRIILRDTVTAEDKEAALPLFTVLFHFPQDKQITLEKLDHVRVESPLGNRLILEFDPAPESLTLVSGAEDGSGTRGSWVSESITQVEPSQCVRVRFKGTSRCKSTLTLCAGDRGNQHNHSFHEND